MSDTAHEMETRRNPTLEGVTSFQAIPDDDRELACIAFQDFEHRKYEQCLGTLKKLHSKRPQDSKVYHNSCVTEYYLSNCKNTTTFNRSMADVCKQAHIDIQGLEGPDDDDNCVVLYNQAVILFHLHQFHSAISILDKVFHVIESLNEMLAKNICFLLLELYLCVYQPKKALFLVGYMETMVFSGNKNSNNGSKSNQKEKDDSASDSCTITEAVKRRLQLCKARCYAMIKTSKACKREIKNLMSSGSGIQNLPAFYLKSQLEYQRGNYRKALKLLNSVTLPDNFSKYFRQTGDCLQAIFYNNVGCIHFYMGKPHLGQFYMKKALEQFDSELNSVTDASIVSKLNSRSLHLMSVSTRHQLLYNLGMQYLQGQRFYDAFNCLVAVCRSYHSNPRLWLRLAECCIHIHKPDNVRQFVKCEKKPFVKTMVGSGPHNKLILNHSSTSEKPLLGDDNAPRSFSDTEVTPTLQFAILALKNALALLSEHQSLITATKESSPSDFQGSAAEDSDVVSASSEENNNNTLPTLPANFIQSCEILSLRNSILAACSYVSLCLGDVILAHEYAETLLAQTRISAAHKFLAHLYAGESLLLMDRITEAVDHLLYFQQQHSNGDIELAYPAINNSPEISLKHQMRFDLKVVSEKYDDGSRPVGNIPNWFPNAISSARFVAQYNLAVAYALREEWSKATECLLQMNHSTNGSGGGEVPSQALSLLIYVQYHQGATDNAKVNVKQCLSRNQ